MDMSATGARLERRSHTLILGGARSGKSRLAEALAATSGSEVVVIATATAGDEGMRMRIAARQARRPARWRLIEEPLALAGTLRAHARPGRLLLVDCLTLWLNNLMTHPDSRRWLAERDEFFAALADLTGQLLLVCNEAGLGIVPAGEHSRRFCDEAGWLHQELARRCDRVVFTVAGLPQLLKGTPWMPNS